MKKFLVAFSVFAIILSCALFQSNVAQADVSYCNVNGRHHLPNRRNHEFNIAKVDVKGDLLHGSLWTCDCGSQVITYYEGSTPKYCYPSECRIGQSPGYPVIGYTWYIPNSSYSGRPSGWDGIN